jgi:hypothetical protein
MSFPREPAAEHGRSATRRAERMVGIIRRKDFVMLSFWRRRYRLRHLPTGRQWERERQPGQRHFDAKRLLYTEATLDLIASGWQPDADWKRRLAVLEHLASLSLWGRLKVVLGLSRLPDD